MKYRDHRSVPIIAHETLDEGTGDLAVAASKERNLCTNIT
jgi:hypothetical protein